MNALTLPGPDETAALARKHAPPGARVAVVEDDLLCKRLHAQPAGWPPKGDADIIVCRSLARFGGAVAAGHALAAAGAPRAVVSDVVWQTAPTAELARAFAPGAPGHDKVRPVEMLVSGNLPQSSNDTLEISPHHKKPKDTIG